MVSAVLRGIELALFSYAPLRAKLRRVESVLESDDPNMDTMVRLDPAHMPVMRVVPTSVSLNAHATSSSSRNDLEFQVEIATGENKFDLLGDLLELAETAVNRSAWAMPTYVKKIELGDGRVMNAKEIEGISTSMTWVALLTIKVLIMYSRR